LLPQRPPNTITCGLGFQYVIFEEDTDVQTIAMYIVTGQKREKKDDSLPCLV
jgi:hypothetical protein